MKISSILAMLFGLCLMIYGYMTDSTELYGELFWGFISIFMGLLLLCFIDVEAQFPQDADFWNHDYDRDGWK